MSADPEVTCGSQHCITCGDDGDPMTVLRVDAERGLALCRTLEGDRATVETALVEPVAPGEHLLVHAGTAIARLERADGDREAA
ncbi:MAG TPA: HypC/HybG/HupF family hydrogenase formation chaperone [Solirubrobacteraceae bacterium]